MDRLFATATTSPQTKRRSAGTADCELVQRIIVDGNYFSPLQNEILCSLLFTILLFSSEFFPPLSDNFQRKSDIFKRKRTIFLKYKFRFKSEYNFVEPTSK